MPHLGTIVRWACGLGLITCGAFAYVDEERTIKNRLVDLWYRITVASERATAGVVAGTGLALRTLERVMAWLYGPRVISLQGAWTGLMVSLAAFPVFAGAIFLYLAPRTYRDLGAKHGSLIVGGVLVLMIGLAVVMTWGLFVAANLPARFKRFRFTVAGVNDLGAGVLVSFSVIVLYLRVLRAVVGQGKFVHPWLGIALMLAFGALENMVSMAILRWASRRWEKGSHQQGLGRIASAAIVLLSGWGALFILVRAPALLALQHGSRDLGWNALVLSILTNALEVIFILGLLSVVLAFLLHAAAWDALLRLVERLHVELPKKTLVAVGVLILTGKPIWESIKKGLEIPAPESVQAVQAAQRSDGGVALKR